MDWPDRAPAHVDIERPNAARMYDHYLGGAHNIAVDRELAERALTVLPHGQQMAQQNRAFLRRAVRHVAAAGVRQFLDIGAGIPTRGNTHEVAQEVAPDVRVVYVDFDPVAVTHSQAILAGNSQARVIAQDLRQHEQILAHHDLLGLLDLDQPVAVLMLAVLHFIPDADNPAGVIVRYRDALARAAIDSISNVTCRSRTSATVRGNVMAGSGRGHDPQGSPTASGGSTNEAGIGHRHSIRDRSLPPTRSNGYMPRRAGAKPRW